MDTDQDHENTFRGSCTYCAEKIRITDFCQLKRGDHILLPGQHSRFNIKKRLIYFYTHHAIVKGVKIIDGITTKACVECIHFYTHPFRSCSEVQESNMLFDLINDEIYMQKYLYPGNDNDPERIIKRAEEKMNEKKKYNLCCNNCEHFATFASAGVSDSGQTRSILSCLRIVMEEVASIGNIVGNSFDRVPLLKAILKLVVKESFATADDTTAVTTETVTTSLHKYLVPTYVLGGMLFLYLVVCIGKSIHMIYKYWNKKGICLECLKSELADLWTNFFQFAVTQAAGLALLGFVVIPFLSTPMGICTGILLSLTNVACFYGLKKLYTKVRSPFNGMLKKKVNVSEIQKGDIVRLSELYHDCIVNDVHQDVSGKTWTVSAIHYRNGVFKKGKIELHDFTVKKGEKITRRELGKISCFTPDQVVERANKRLGEERFNLISNRSCHLCYWAKVDQTPQYHDTESVTMKYVREYDEDEDKNKEELRKDNTKNRPYSTMKMASVDVWIGEDICKGDIIELKGKIGIVSKIKITAEKEYTLSVLALDQNKKAANMDWQLKLNTHNVKKHRYHPAFLFGKEHIIQRAVDRLGIVFENDTKFIIDVVQKKFDMRRVKSFGDFCEGEVISYGQFNTRDAIVLEKNPVNVESSEPARKGTITIIHYSGREVRTDHLNVNFEHGQYSIRTYEGFETYPLLVSIERALSRLGERKYSLTSNRSSHFCYWGRVLQSPCIYSMSNPELEKDMVFIPEVCNIPENDYIKVELYSFTELCIGKLIEFKNLKSVSATSRDLSGYGIVTKCQADGHIIELVHVVQKTRLVQETVVVNMPRDRIWVYRWRLDKCFTPAEIIRRIAQNLEPIDRITSEFVYLRKIILKDNKSSLPCQCVSEDTICCLLR